jgi:prepilin-type processing-associated H-X9-DG protein
MMRHFPAARMVGVPLGWGGEIFPYVKSTDAYRCPDDPTDPQIVTVAGISHKVYPVSYAYNGFDGGATATYGTARDEGRLVQFNEPEKTVLLSEIQSRTDSGPGIIFKDLADITEINEGWPDWNPGPYSCSDAIGILPQNGTATLQNATGYQGGPKRSFWFQWTFFYPSKDGRHSGGSNYAACDGHVKWLLGDYVSTGYISNSALNIRQIQPNWGEDQFFSDECAGTESSEPWQMTYSPR